MTPRTATMLGLAAAVAMGGAVWQWQANRAGFVEAERGERLLPGLLAKANDVAAISVRQGERTFRIVRNEDTSYKLAGSEFPVKGGKFQSAIVAAASLEKFEAKTAREDKYAQIEVGDPAVADAKGRLVTFEDAAAATRWPRSFSARRRVAVSVEPLPMASTCACRATSRAGWCVVWWRARPSCRPGSTMASLR
jgi:hypothetical protein